MKIQGNHCQFLVCTANTIHRHRQGMFRLEAISLPNIINGFNTMGNSSSYILTTHVECESCRKPTFALPVIHVAVHFRIRTDRKNLSHWGTWCEDVVNLISSVFPGLKTVMLSTCRNNVPDDKTTHTEFIEYYTWKLWQHPHDKTTELTCTNPCYKGDVVKFHDR